MVIWSEVAKEDLSNIFQFIALDSRIYALKVVDEIIALSEKLDAFPQAGKKVKEHRYEEIREVSVYSYRLIYRVSNQGIHVVTILHMKRKQPRF